MKTHRAHINFYYLAVLFVALILIALALIGLFMRGSTPLAVIPPTLLAAWAISNLDEK